MRKYCCRGCIVLLMLVSVFMMFPASTVNAASLKKVTEVKLSKQKNSTYVLKFLKCINHCNIFDEFSIHFDQRILSQRFFLSPKYPPSLQPTVITFFLAPIGEIVISDEFGCNRWIDGLIYCHISTHVI